MRCRPPSMRGVIEADDLSKVVLYNRVSGAVGDIMHVGFNEGKVCDAVLRRIEMREGAARANCR
jgi:hypothetical protein